MGQLKKINSQKAFSKIQGYATELFNINITKASNRSFVSNFEVGADCKSVYISMNTMCN